MKYTCKVHQFGRFTDKAVCLEKYHTVYLYCSYESLSYESAKSMFHTYHANIVDCRPSYIVKYTHIIDIDTICLALLNQDQNETCI